MKAADVKINGLYLAKVTKQVVTVKITGKHKSGGWHAINTATGKKIHIKSAERLEGPAKSEPKPEADKTVRKPAGDESPKPEKKLSLVGAALQILEAAEEPMSCKAIVEQTLEQGLWQPAKGGKTPANTLYSTILQEIRKKGENARFKKTAPGKFSINK
jgi:hypothetical protein